MTIKDALTYPFYSSLFIIVLVCVFDIFEKSII